MFLERSEELDRKHLVSSPSSVLFFVGTMVKAIPKRKVLGVKNTGGAKLKFDPSSSAALQCAHMLLESSRSSTSPVSLAPSRLPIFTYFHQISLLVI